MAAEEVLLDFVQSIHGWDGVQHAREGAHSAHERPWRQIPEVGWILLPIITTQWLLVKQSFSTIISGGAGSISIPHTVKSTLRTGGPSLLALAAAWDRVRVCKG